MQIQNNEIPESLKKAEVDGLSLEKLDEALNEGAFKCSPISSCACGAGQSKGEFAKTLLEIIGLKDPDTIKISKA